MKLHVCAFLLLSLGIMTGCSNDLDDVASAPKAEKETKTILVSLHGNVGNPKDKKPGAISSKSFDLRRGENGDRSSVQADGPVNLYYLSGTDFNYTIYIGIDTWDEHDHHEKALVCVPMNYVIKEGGQSITFPIRLNMAASKMTTSPGFSEMIEKYPNNRAFYVSGLAGGKVMDNKQGVSVRSFAPNEGGDTLSYNEEYLYFKNSELKKGNRKITHAFYQSGLRGIDVPLSTGKWQRVGTDSAQYNNGKLKITIPNLYFTPVGNLIGYEFQSNRAYSTILNALAIHSDDNKLWYGKVDVQYDDNFDGSYRLIKKGSNLDTIYLKGVDVPVNKKSNALYLWSYGSGHINIGVSVNMVDNMSPEITKNHQIPETGTYLTDRGWGIPYQRSVHIEDGYTYNYLINKNQNSYEGLIITELYHNNPSRAKGGNNTVVELYNPTNHKIDLAHYGLIRLVGYNRYFRGDGAIAQARRRFASNDINKAKVQILSTIHERDWYVNPAFGIVERTPGGAGEKIFNEPVYDMEGKKISDKIYNRTWAFYPNEETVKKDPRTIRYLEPGKTCVLLAGRSIVSRWLTNPYKKILQHAYVKGKCQFVMGLDNGYLQNSYGNEGNGAAAGTLQHTTRDGIALVVTDDVNHNGKWKMVDAIGPTADGVLSGIDNQKDDFWYKYFIKYTGVPAMSTTDKEYSWTRSIYDNRQSTKFISRIGKGIYNTDMNHLFDEKYSSWLLFTGKTNTGLVEHASLGFRSYEEYDQSKKIKNIYHRKI